MTIHWQYTSLAFLLVFVLVQTNAKAQSQSSEELPTWGQAHGEGIFSINEKAHAMQLSLSFDLPLSIALVDSKISAHNPIIASDVMLRLWQHESRPRQSLWMGASVLPIGVSLAYPSAQRLSRQGSVLNRTQLIGTTPLGSGALKITAGLTRQHLGRSDSLYWTSLTPHQLTSEKLRLFDTALGVNLTYLQGSYLLNIGVGQPVERDVSPFQSAEGFRGQLITGWATKDAKVLAGARTDQGRTQNDYEGNLSWRLPLRLVSLDVPVAYLGEVGGLHKVEFHKYALGGLYAHHEVEVSLKPVTLRLRYDWIDRDTNLKYDTLHIARARIDYHGIDYFALSLQYRHRWRDTEDRFETEHDDILIFARVLY